MQCRYDAMYANIIIYSLIYVLPACISGGDCHMWDNRWVMVTYYVTHEISLPFTISSSFYC